MANLFDPSSLTDEELDKLIAGEELPEEDEQPDEPVAEPKVEDDPKPKQDDPDAAEDAEDDDPTPTPPASEDDEEEEVVKPSRREQLRINQLLQKMKEQPQKPADHKPADDPNNFDYRSELNADEETIKLLEEDRRRAAKVAADESYDRAAKLNESSQWQTLLYVDAPVIEGKYEMLNPNDKENFHPVLAETLTNQYLEMVGYDPQTKLVDKPNIRWVDFVESTFELAEEIAAQRVAKTTTAIKKQAATTAVRPDGSTTTKLNLNKAPQDMTDEELDAYLERLAPSR